MFRRLAHFDRSFRQTVMQVSDQEMRQVGGFIVALTIQRRRRSAVAHRRVPRVDNEGAVRGPMLMPNRPAGDVNEDGLSARPSDHRLVRCRVEHTCGLPPDIVERLKQSAYPAERDAHFAVLLILDCGGDA